MKTALEKHKGTPDELGLKPARLVLDEATGFTVRAPYTVWSHREFLDEWVVDHRQFLAGKTKVTLANIISEFGLPEEAIVAHSGPRILEFQNFEMTRETEGIMHHHVREGQPSDTFKWAVGQDQKAEWLNFHAGRKGRAPTVGQIRAAVETHMNDLEKQEDRDQAKVSKNDGQSSDESSEGGDDTQGLAMPKRRGGGGGGQKGGKRPAKKTAPKAAAHAPRATPQRRVDSSGASARSSGLGSIAIAGVQLSNDQSSPPGRAGAGIKSARSAMSEHYGKEGMSACSTTTAAGGKGGRHFDWARVLSGETTRNAVTGARRTLESLRGQTKAYNKLSQEIECFEHVNVLKLAELPKLPLPKMQQAIRESRRLCGVEFPLQVWQDLCLKFGSDLLSKECWSEFAKSCRPWRLEGKEKFNVTTPHLSALICSKMPCDEDTDKLLAQTMFSLFFSDSVCMLFSLLPLETNSVGMPVCLAVAILEKYQAVANEALEAVPPKLCAAMDTIFLACRAILAVSSPIPHWHDATYEDAQKVFGPEQLEDSASAMSAYGPDAMGMVEDIRVAAMKNSHWRARVQSSWTSGLADSSVGEEYHEIVKSLCQIWPTSVESSLAQSSSASWTARRRRRRGNPTPAQRARPSTSSASSRPSGAIRIPLGGRCCPPRRPSWTSKRRARSWRHMT